MTLRGRITRLPFSGGRERERSDRPVRPSATAGWAALVSRAPLLNTEDLPQLTIDVREDEHQVPTGLLRGTRPNSKAGKPFHVALATRLSEHELGRTRMPLTAR